MEQMREAMDGLVARASALLRRLRFFRLGATGALRGTIVTTGGPQVSPQASPQVSTGGPALFSGWRTGGAVPTGAPTAQPLAPTQPSSIPPATPPSWDAPDTPTTPPSAGAASSLPAIAESTPASALSVDAEIAEAGPESRNRQTVPIPIVEGTLADAVDAGYAPDSMEASDDRQTMPLSAEELRRKTAPPDLADREAPPVPNAE
jgi:hypothetical protein